MPPHLLLGLVLLIALMIAVSWLKRTPPAVRARWLQQGLIAAGVVLLLFLLATGRLHWLFALAAAAVPLIQRLHRARQIYDRVKGNRGPTTAQSSDVETRFLRMSLNHTTGAMSGVVLTGRFRGRRLDELSLEQLLALLSECQAEDPESAPVLEAYLDRTHGDNWRDHQAQGETRSHAAGNGRMTRAEAYEILGLGPGASAEEITEAHRRLMQKLHPDRGGSTYLAAKINQAKDLLLASH